MSLSARRKTALIAGLLAAFQALRVQAAVTDVPGEGLVFRPESAAARVPIETPASALLFPAALPADFFPAPEPIASPLAAAVETRVTRQIAEAQADQPRHEAALRVIKEGAGVFLREIDKLLLTGEIDPRPVLRVQEGDRPRARFKRTLRVGVYPVTADPVHWGHLLVGLQAVARLKLDKVVYIVAGDDARKPNMTRADWRFCMVHDVLQPFSPFFALSPIAYGTGFDGEINIFRLLALNGAQKIDAYYMVGDDHYRRLDKRGEPDTLGKLERNMKHPALGLDASRHSIGVAFIEREGRREQEKIPTALEVQFLPHLGFDASSSRIRSGETWLMPQDAVRWIRDNAPGLYGIGK